MFPNDYLECQKENKQPNRTVFLTKKINCEALNGEKKERNR
jgi:hypothetical protein